MIAMLKAWILCSILLIGALSGCLNEKPAENVTENKTNATATPTLYMVPEPTTVYVTIMGSRFNPIELKVVNGTTVRWTNLDSALHMVNVDGSRSPPLYKRDSWSYTFNKTGIFEFNCSIHPTMSKGRIIVE
jgi:plastocyanin